MDFLFFIKFQSKLISNYFCKPPFSGRSKCRFNLYFIFHERIMVLCSSKYRKGKHVHCNLFSKLRPKAEMLDMLHIPTLLKMAFKQLSNQAGVK